MTYSITQFVPPARSRDRIKERFAFVNILRYLHYNGLFAASFCAKQEGCFRAQINRCTYWFHGSVVGEAEKRIWNRFVNQIPFVICGFARHSSDQFHHHPFVCLRNRHRGCIPHRHRTRSSHRKY
jgi:hypothetical protein